MAAADCICFIMVVGNTPHFLGQNYDLTPHQANALSDAHRALSVGENIECQVLIKRTADLKRISFKEDDVHTNTINSYETKIQPRIQYQLKKFWRKKDNIKGNKTVDEQMSIEKEKQDQQSVKRGQRSWMRKLGMLTETAKERK